MPALSADRRFGSRDGGEAVGEGEEEEEEEEKEDEDGGKGMGRKN